ncbi:hypothetical protein V8G54_017169 [Vigna mungo]|uniref:Autophagy-related protein n=1 Tax=Vigna mungo TaxID=3915 RepID=A0AAQ3RYH8_VIGMU
MPERRQAESARIRDKYPDRIPVIVERAERTDIPDIDKKKLVIILGLSFVCCVSNNVTVVWTVKMDKLEADQHRTIDALFLRAKYLVPADLTVGQFVYVVRKRIKVGAEKAIFVFINNTLPPTAALMSSIYEENKDDDGFLYMTYSGENTFGSH